MDSERNRSGPSLVRLQQAAEQLAGCVEARVPELTALYVFGSTATGLRRPDSDVDLALLAAAPIRVVERVELQGELSDLVHAHVDLVDLRRASTVFQMQIVSKGAVLVERDPVGRAVFEDFVFASYARLNEERREILEQVVREGRVYGG